MAVRAGYIDAEMRAAADAPKARPEDIVARVIERLHADSEQVLADDRSGRAKLEFNATSAFYLRSDTLRLVPTGVE